jgi:hypothetical protein
MRKRHGRQDGAALRLQMLRLQPSINPLKGFNALLEQFAELSAIVGAMAATPHHADLQIQNRRDRFCGGRFPGGAYIITQKMPERDGEFEYRVRSSREPHERVVRESQLRAAP